MRVYASWKLWVMLIYSNKSISQKLFILKRNIYTTISSMWIEHIHITLHVLQDGHQRMGAYGIEGMRIEFRNKLEEYKKGLCWSHYTAILWKKQDLPTYAICSWWGEKLSWQHSGESPKKDLRAREMMS